MMIVETAVIAMAPVVLWVWSRQLTVNQTSRDNAITITEIKDDLKGVKDDANHTRNRVDKIYDHLISRGK